MTFLSTWGFMNKLNSLKIFIVILSVFVIDCSYAQTAQTAQTAQAAQAAQAAQTNPPPQQQILAPGYGKLEFSAPEPGSYTLPVLGSAADGKVLDTQGTP